MGESNMLRNIIIMSLAIIFIAAGSCFAVTNNITAEGRLDVTNSITGASIYVTGNATATAYYGDGSHLTGISASSAAYSILSGYSSAAALVATGGVTSGAL